VYLSYLKFHWRIVCYVIRLRFLEEIFTCFTYRGTSYIEKRSRFLCLCAFELVLPKRVKVAINVRYNMLEDPCFYR
jgi:hypothetical protein